MSILVYGAYGYTGQLIVDEAVRRGLEPIAAGRDPERLRELGERTGLETRVCSLDDAAGLRAMLQGVELVVHAAGPFTRTWRAMATACLDAGSHYTDITGEIPVFEKLAVMDAESKARGVMTMPGVGFDVVPSDSLAAHLKRRLPTATHFELAVSSGGVGPSRGTLKTLFRHAGRPGLERRDGALVPVPVGARQRDVDFGPYTRRTISIPWGDLSSAYQSTGVPNIVCYFDYPGPMRHAATRLHWLAPLVQTSAAQALLRWYAETLYPAGPDERTRQTARSYVWGEMRDETGNVVRARQSGPEIYAMTAVTAVDIALRVLDGEARPGYWTPSRLFGPDYVLGLDGFEREDIV